MNNEKKITEYVEITEYITRWIFDYAQKSNINTLIVGVSGGVDSALVSTLAAMTTLKTVLVEMPIRTNDNYATDETPSTRHIKSLQQRFTNIQHERVDLTEPFKVFKEQLRKDSKLADNANFELSMANAASRLRMMTLYSFSNTYRGLVVGTGNKVEDFGIGFFTVGGDGQVDLSPIGDLLKSEVYQMAAHLGVNDEILKSKPTDGLWDDGRTDEDQIGATYDELEWAMEFYRTSNVERAAGYDIYEISKKLKGELTEREREVLQIYIKRHDANSFKMKPIPVCEIPNDLK